MANTHTSTVTNINVTSSGGTTTISEYNTKGIFNVGDFVHLIIKVPKQSIPSGPIIWWMKDTGYDIGYKFKLLYPDLIKENLNAGYSQIDLILQLQSLPTVYEPIAEASYTLTNSGDPHPDIYMSKLTPAIPIVNLSIDQKEVKTLFIDGKQVASLSIDSKPIGIGGGSVSSIFVPNPMMSAGSDQNWGMVLSPTLYNAYHYLSTFAKHSVMSKSWVDDPTATVDFGNHGSNFYTKFIDEGQVLHLKYQIRGVNYYSYDIPMSTFSRNEAAWVGNALKIRIKDNHMELKFLTTREVLITEWDIS